eukprot:6750886-Prymnesium_polylepis.2
MGVTTWLTAADADGAADAGTTASIVGAAVALRKLIIIDSGRSADDGAQLGTQAELSLCGSCLRATCQQPAVPY